MDRATKFREAAAEANRDRQRTGWRYPKALRRLAVAYCRDRRRAGRPLAEIVEELDITAMTLSRWLDNDEPWPSQGNAWHRKAASQGNAWHRKAAAKSCW